MCPSSETSFRGDDIQVSYCTIDHVVVHIAQSTKPSLCEHFVSYSVQFTSISRINSFKK